MLTDKQAHTIAAQEALKLFTHEELNRMGAWWGNTLTEYHFSLGRGEERKVDTSKPPCVDETIPWKEVVDIIVDKRTGAVSVRRRQNVSIFD